MKKYLLLFSLLFIQQKDLQAQYVFNWAKSSSGTGAEVVSNLCSDANNNIYLSIYFNSSSIDIDMGPGTVNLTSAAAGNDGVIAKYDQNGNYQWAVHFNSSINSQVTNAVVDASGSVYVVGYFRGVLDFDPGAGVSNLSHTNSNIVPFIAKYDVNGNYLWANKMDGSLYDLFVYDIVLNSTGQFYVCGKFSGPVDLNLGAGAANFNPVTNSSPDMFVAAYNASDCSYVGAYTIGNGINTAANTITTDASGNAIIGGQFSGTVDFDPGVGVTNLTSSGTNTGFLIKINTTGALVWASLENTVKEVIADPSNNIYLLTDRYIAKYDPSNIIQWSKDFGGVTQPGGLIRDLNGDIIICGTGEANLNGTASKILLKGGAYYAKYTPDGTLKSFNSLNGGAARGVVCDAIGNLIIGGHFFAATDFDPTANGTNIITPVGFDVFLAKYTNCSGYTSSENIVLCTGESVTIGSNNYVAVGTQVYVNNAFALDTPLLLEEMLSSQSGCDSLATINIVTEAINTTVNFGSGILSSPSTSTGIILYQWLDCNNAYAIIPGANSQTYTPSVSGNYAVRLDQNGCIDTSVCRAVTIAPTAVLSVDDLNAGINIYPNPVTDDVLHWNVKLSDHIEAVVYNTIGDVVLIKKLSGNDGALDISTLPNGLYLITLESEKGKAFKRFQKNSF